MRRQSHTAPRASTRDRRVIARPSFRNCAVPKKAPPCFLGMWGGGGKEGQYCNARRKPHVGSGQCMPGYALEHYCKIWIGSLVGSTVLERFGDDGQHETSTAAGAAAVVDRPGHGGDHAGPRGRAARRWTSHGCREEPPRASTRTWLSDTYLDEQAPPRCEASLVCSRAGASRPRVHPRHVATRAFQPPRVHLTVGFDGHPRYDPAA